MARHAVYATVRTSRGHITFRIGQPTTLDKAQARWQRLDNRRFYAKRAQRIRFDGKWWHIPGNAPWAFEVRTVDYFGRGLGSERHGNAFPVPYRALRVAR